MVACQLRCVEIDIQYQRGRFFIDCLQRLCPPISDFFSHKIHILRCNVELIVVGGVGNVNIYIYIHGLFRQEHSPAAYPFVKFTFFSRSSPGTACAASAATFSIFLRVKVETGLNDDLDGLGVKVLVYR